MHVDWAVTLQAAGYLLAVAAFILFVVLVMV
jgi:hypothetical protein